MLNIVLYQPEIAPNCGNIIRLCANSGASLHLIEPLGFIWEDRRLQRAGLDYHEYASVQRHLDLESCRAAVPGRWFAFSTRNARNHDQARFAEGDTLLFGPETRGLPDSVLELIPDDQRLRLPMIEGSRSLNLSNSVAIGLYEAWRQLGFQGASTACRN